MILQNYNELATNSKKKTALKVLEDGLIAAEPKKSIKKIIKSNKIIIPKKPINLSNYQNVYVVAFGKAADSMTKAINSFLKIKGGIIVIPKGSKSQVNSKKFKIYFSGHPIPNNTSKQSAQAILKFLKNKKKTDFVIFLISGGGSALLALPNGISLNEKIKVTNILLKSGANIQEFNCIRKHLSKIKGGMMVQNLNCDAVSLIMSDVNNNDISSISSGCTYYDTTTFKDAQKIIKKYNLNKKIPKNVLKHIQKGVLGKINETPKKSRIKNLIIASNADCLNSMAKKAKQLGYATKVVTISDDVNTAAKKLSRIVPKKKNSCVIFGGETTVKVTGKGKGGRNQQLVLCLLEYLQKSKQDLVFSSLGTDGIDGNTNYAGAITDNFQISSKKIKSYLKNNNSNAFFKKYGGLIKTGYTHTNLLDIGIILN